jgi:hypothetical protein
VSGERDLLLAWGLAASVLGAVAWLLTAVTAAGAGWSFLAGVVVGHGLVLVYIARDGWRGCRVSREEFERHVEADRAVLHRMPIPVTGHLTPEQVAAYHANLDRLCDEKLASFGEGDA